LLSHQIGGFLGAYLGGLTITRFGDFGWMWYADIVLSLLAALLNLPIREARIERHIDTAHMAPVATKGSVP
jgi:predicted MFS family arabinose efflux permease